MGLSFNRTHDSSFMDEGLTFECKKGCSLCCGGSPGYVWLFPEEVVLISRQLGITVPEFILEYTKDVDGELSVKDVEEDNWNCIFLKQGKCTIYTVRPHQCRTYPFWPQNILSEERWDKTARECPGVGTGKCYSKKQIMDIVEEGETIDSLR